MEVNKELVAKVVGALCLAYGLYPLWYSKLDNVPDTGNAAQDNFAENAHDALATFATFFTLIQAGVGYAILRVVLYLLPDALFATKA